MGTSSRLDDLLAHLEPAEREEFETLLASDDAIWRPLAGPQQDAVDSLADVTGYGGAGGGGKTDCVAGLAITQHKRVLIVRREKAQCEGVIQRLGELVGSSDGLNAQKGIWKIPVGSQPLIEFGGLDNVGDERRWQGRAHDLIAFDEVTECREAQVRFLLGWARTTDARIRPRVLMTFNPPSGPEGEWVIRFFAPWLDEAHPHPAAPGELRWFTTLKGKDIEVPDAKPFVLKNGEPIYDFDEKLYAPEQIIKPRSRTFIAARVVDNPYLAQTNYIGELQALPEPLRSQLLYGDFKAAVGTNPWQVIPTAWVKAAQARWTRADRLPAMDSLGVDVARGGKDETVISRRHGAWFDELLSYPGSATPDGPACAGLVVAAMRNAAPVHIDVIGVGAAPYDHLRNMGMQVTGVNVSERATGMDKSGRLSFKNLRSMLWWRMREALDPANNTGIALPPDPRLLADLTAPTWKVAGSTIAVASREEIVAKIGRSPDRGTAVVLGLIDTPTWAVVNEITGRRGAQKPYSWKEILRAGTINNRK